jgi:two-component system chemotaxis sensor kinase CheA
VRAQALDQLLDQAAEVLHGIARLREVSRKLPEAQVAAFEVEVDRLRRSARELHGRVMNARLTPFSSLTERLPRAVRDLAHRLGKEVDFEVQGAEVELDRTVIDALGDPLTHLVRNAVDHGLEGTTQRLAAGKSPRGKLVLTARRERDKVLVDVGDDGRGFDADLLRKRAVALSLLTAEKAAQLSEEHAFELAFLPGLSTRAAATDVSGRGVGLDAVKSAVEGLGGKISLRSAPGKGTRFTMELPLSVSMANLLVVQVGGELYGLPLHRVVVTTESDLSARGGEGFEARSLAVMGQLVRAYSLAKLFGLPSLAPPGPRPFAVLEVDGLTFALAVDRLVGQEEAVLKPLFPPLDRIKGLAGTTVLGNGRPLLVLDPRGLHELAASPRMKGAA